MFLLCTLPVLLAASALLDVEGIDKLDRAAVLDDVSAVEAYGRLRASTRDPALLTALDLARARRAERAQGPAAGYAMLKRTRPPAAMAPAVVDERLRLARSAGDERGVLHILSARLRSAPRRARHGQVNELVDLALGSHRNATLSDVVTVLDGDLDSEMLQVLHLAQAVAARRESESVELSRTALTTLRSPDAVRRLDRVLREATLWNTVVAGLPRRDRIATAQKLIAAGQPAQALVVLSTLRDGVDSDLTWIQALAALRRHEDALVRCMAALTRTPAHARGPLLLERARLESRLGHGAAARASYGEFAALFEKDPEADQASFFSAWLSHEEGSSQDAADGFGRYLEQRPRGSYAELARWLQALNLYRTGDDAATLRVLEPLRLECRDAEIQTAVRYLHARALARQGLWDEARGELDAMISGALKPADKAPYYRTLARAARRRLDKDSAGVSPEPSCGGNARLPGASVADLRAGPPEGSAPAAAGVPACVMPLRAGVQGMLGDLKKDQAQALKALAAVGLCDVAARVLRSVGLPRADAARRRHLETALAAGDATRVLRLAGRHYRSALEQPFSDENRWLWRLAYPVPSAFDTLPETRVSPALVRAVARQESHFLMDARSRVGALGLMQLMPATGARLGMLADVGVDDDSVLLEPETNIRLASFYLALLSDEFRGSVPLVLAAYNGGPRNVQSWLERHGEQPMDLWVESIPFRETRGYVKKVLSAAIVYSWLDGDALPLDWLDAPCADVETAHRIEF
ncbi:MAG: lytic transglycosylase domain-containing protein [Pseudomonadota bacterium]